MRPIQGAKVLAYLGDTVTTDHISPAGGISPTSPAAKYLLAHSVEKSERNQYAPVGQSRGEMRGTFANIRIRHRLVSASRAGSPSSARRASR